MISCMRNHPFGSAFVFRSWVTLRRASSRRKQVHAVFCQGHSILIRTCSITSSRCSAKCSTGATRGFLPAARKSRIAALRRHATVCALTGCFTVFVLAQGNVTHPMQSILYAPMPSRQSQQARCVGLTRGAGDHAGSASIGCVSRLPFTSYSV